MSEAIVRVRLTIEPSWTTSHYDEVIEIGAAELEGLSPAERARKIIDIAEDTVNDVCAWGASEIRADDDE
jgi:hypothetical protein